MLVYSSTIYLNLQVSLINKKFSRTDYTLFA